MDVNVRVMLSYDYNHFEISLSKDCDKLVDANELRKDAQRLADEAIRQYKIAKKMAEQKLNREHEKSQLIQEIEMIRHIPESEWNAVQKAKIKALEDEKYWNEFDYDYENDW